MAIKRTKYAVAYFDSDREIVEREIETIGADELRAEMEARRSGIAGPRASSDGDRADVNDLGDVRNRDALTLWAALVRLGHYNEKSQKFRLEDYVGAEKLGDPEPVDPTPPAESTASA